MLPTITEDFYQTNEDHDKRTDLSIPDGFIKPLYSKEISPEEKVKLAIQKIEEDIKQITILPESPIEERVVILRKPEPFKDNYILLQQWEGVVLEVHEDYFTSQLHELSGNSPDETAEIPLDEISDVDLNLITPGAFFYWNIGYYVNKSGQRTRSSMIRFRRLPAWSKNELERSKKAAEEISKKLRWGTDVSNSLRKETG